MLRLSALALEKALAVIRREEDKVRRLAEALLSKEALDREEIEQVLGRPAFGDR